MATTLTATATLEKLHSDAHHKLTSPSTPIRHGSRFLQTVRARLDPLVRRLTKFAKFVGPGMMVSVAYIDPGNYATDVSAGAAYKFQLLWVLLMSNFFAVFLQSLCAKLGIVTGRNLAEQCRMFLPRWVNILLWAFAEVAIVATDIAEVSLTRPFFGDCLRNNIGVRPGRLTSFSYLGYWLCHRP
jgi:metal iron transporter